jgi:hypothetical protein
MIKKLEKSIVSSFKNEDECTAIDRHLSCGRKAFDNETWRDYLNTRCELLGDYSECFLVLQHPSTSQTLRELAHKYCMTARVWKNGIYQFLDALQHRLPDSFDLMLCFTQLAWSTMTWFYEMIFAYKDVWAECLGDLARYRSVL